MFQADLVFTLEEKNSFFISVSHERWIKRHLPVEIERISKGILFYGPPGNGKTELASVIANKLKKPLHKYFCQNFLKRYLGDGEEQLKNAFEKANEAKAIVFFDEIDAICGDRNFSTNDHFTSLISTFLTLMNNFDCIVIGATNRIESLDPAIRRPGRFGFELYFDYPSLQDRIEFLHFLLKNIIFCFNVEDVARICQKYSYADLKHVIEIGVLNRISDADPVLREYHLKYKKNCISKKILAYVERFTKSENILFFGSDAFVVLNAFHYTLTNSIIVTQLPLCNLSSDYVLLNRLEQFNEHDVISLLEYCYIHKKVVIASHFKEISSSINIFFKNRCIVDSKVVL